MWSNPPLVFKEHSGCSNTKPSWHWWFLPLSVGENSVWFLDALVNANFADREGYSSIINTDVAGGTVSTSTRVGYRWLNSDRSWMFGLNGGYDSRPVKSGGTDTGISVTTSAQRSFSRSH
jgi:hypothetical protein